MKNLKSFSKSKKAVTLIEILIAFIILSVAAIGASGIISQGHKATGQDSRRGEALQILVDRMNYLSSLKFDTLSSNIGSINRPFNGVKFGNEVAVGKNKYNIIADLQMVSVTIKDLKELDFTKEHFRIGEQTPADYDSSKPETWFFKDRSNETLSNKIIKIKVSVTPTKIKEKANLNERTYEAITFVCKMD